MSRYNCNFYHGVMFHHFHNKLDHPCSQGSIDAKKFEKIINFVGKKNILNPRDFINKLSKGELKKNHVCITFDDGLKSQIDIAVPVLKKYDIKAFFFIATSTFTENPDLLEVFRYFRNNEYKNINEFYKSFFSFCNPKVFSFLS